eukprot:1203556-Rhodomonas_salina.1
MTRSKTRGKRRRRKTRRKRRRRGKGERKEEREEERDEESDLVHCGDAGVLAALVAEGRQLQRLRRVRRLEVRDVLPRALPAAPRPHSQRHRLLSPPLPPHPVPPHALALARAAQC